MICDLNLGLMICDPQHVNLQFADFADSADFADFADLTDFADLESVGLQNSQEFRGSFG